jgi:4-hydroxy-2-oxoglutarate aldolase
VTSERLKGVFPPVATPFDEDGMLATARLRENLQQLVAKDLAGFVILGSNGEYVLMSEKEKLQVLEAARDTIPPNKVMIAGTGTDSTRQTIELTRQAASIGADMAIVVTPSYYKGQMTSAALQAHYLAIADASPIPVLIYNVTMYTGIDIDVDTLAALSQHPNIAGMKESNPNIVKLADTIRRAGADFAVLAGSASFIYPAVKLGATGAVPALANVAPDQCAALLRYSIEGREEEAKALQLRLLPANAAVTSRFGVPGLKAAMDMVGYYGGPPRSPLQPLTSQARAQVAQALIEAGITILYP